MFEVPDFAKKTGKELAHWYKWRTTQFPFEIRRRTFAEMAAYPEMPPPVPSIVRSTFTPWKTEQLAYNFFAQMDIPLEFAMGERTFNYQQLQEYLERERLQTMSPHPRRRTILDQQFTQSDNPVSVAIVDTHIPAYGIGLYPRHWIIQFGMDLDDNVREVAVQKFTALF